MSDPVETVRKIVEQRRTAQARAEAAAGVWQAKLPAIEGYVKEIVAPLEGAGVNVVVAVRGGTLGVQFPKRHLRMVQDSPTSKRWVFETGALFKAAPCCNSRAESGKGTFERTVWTACRCMYRTKNHLVLCSGLIFGLIGG